MGYCAQDDLVARYGEEELKQLTDETSAATIDASEVSAACDEASTLIDTYLGKRYDTPLASPPSCVKTWACAIARLNLWGDKAPDGSAVRSDADDALAVIKDIAKGVGNLPGYETAPAAASNLAVVNERTQTFTDDLFNCHMVSLP